MYNSWFLDAVSEPKLSAVPAVDGGVTLQCEADCWCPQPEITFLDKHGNVISAEEPRTHPDNRGCFNVTRRMTLQTYTSRFDFSLILETLMLLMRIVC